MKQLIELACGCATNGVSYTRHCPRAAELWDKVDAAMFRGKSPFKLHAAYIALRSHGNLPIQVKVEDWTTFG